MLALHPYLGEMSEQTYIDISNMVVNYQLKWNIPIENKTIEHIGKLVANGRSSLYFHHIYNYTDFLIRMQKATSIEYMEDFWDFNFNLITKRIESFSFY
jgi:hypothetical protein